VPAAGGQRPASFPRAARVCSGAEFAHIFACGRRTASPQLALHVLAADEGAARLGLAVSRKVDKRAVGRNRIKRVIRDWFRQTRARLAPGAYVVVARVPAAHTDNAGLRAVLIRLFLRAGVLRPVAGRDVPPAASPLPSPPPPDGSHSIA